MGFTKGNTMKKNPFRIINRAIKEHLATGAKLIPSWNLGRKDGKFVLGEQRCNNENVTCGCPLAMVIDGKKAGENTISQTVCRTLSLPRGWVDSFICGFDRDFFERPGDKTAYNFGKRLRAKHEALGNVI